MNQERKNILVTGVSKGLGLSITETLLLKGYHVYGVSRSQPQPLSDLQAKYPDTLSLKLFDLSRAEDIKTSIFNKEFLPVDIPLHGFVNNAALAYDDIVTNLNLNRLEDMYKVNVFSPMMTVKNVIRNMLFHHIQGSIVHISSVSVHTGYKGLAMYASTKGALEAFSKNTAREWGSKKIRSNCIVAGFMETDMSATLSQDQKDRIYNRTSLKEPTCTKSVAEMVAFLLSDSAKSVTGQNIFVDSGTI